LRKKRFFAPSACWSDGHILLDKSQTHHLISVLRSKTGDCVNCFDDTGKECEARIVSDNPDGAVLDILEFVDVVTSDEPKLVLAQSVIKSARMDMVIQKSVELGIDCIIPFFSSFSVVKLDSQKQASKIKRWQRMTVEAAKQCKRTVIPSVSEFIRFADLVKIFHKYDKVILADPYADKVSLKDEMKDVGDTLIVVGPEGGFDSHERDLAKSQPNCVLFKFNKNILRAETAALGCIAITQYMRFESR